MICDTATCSRWAGVIIEVFLFARLQLSWITGSTEVKQEGFWSRRTNPPPPTPILCFLVRWCMYSPHFFPAPPASQPEVLYAHQENLPQLIGPFQWSEPSIKWILMSPRFTMHPQLDTIGNDLESQPPYKFCEDNLQKMKIKSKYHNCFNCMCVSLCHMRRFFLRNIQLVWVEFYVIF